MNQFKEIAKEEFDKEATPDRLIVSRAMSTIQFDVPTKTNLKVTVEDLVKEFTEYYNHAEYLHATIFATEDNETQVRLNKYFKRENL